MDVLKKNANWMLFFLLAIIVISCNEDDNEPADTEAPVITLVGEDTVNITVGNTFTDPGATATDNIDGDISADIEVSGDVVDTNTEGTYEIAYNVSDEAENAATEVTRTVIVSAEPDTEAPVITLEGEEIINLTVGDTFTDPGATATDNIDGDITENIVVGGDEVDTNTAGTYTITYNVDDAAGNSADEVTRTVNVEESEDFDGGLLTNGDFEDGSDSWLAGVGSDPAPVVTEDGNTYYSVEITSPDPGQPYLVNLSQKLALTSGETYLLTFDAWSDRERGIIAGIGRSEGDFANVNQTVTINDTRDTYTLTLGPIEFGEENNRVLFDNNGAAGLVNIDNVSLIVDDGSGPDTTPPVITLNGNSTVNIAKGETFDDPGATATDNVDGDITANIQVGGDEVDTNTEGTYVITYNVSDAAGNAASEVRRTVNVTQDGSPGNLADNGDFENGEAGWLFFANGGTAELDNSINNGGSNSAKIATNGPSNPGIKQERIGIGTVQAGDVVQIQFDHIGSVTEPGAVFNVLLFVERAEGESGDPITHVFDPRPTLTDSWTTFTATYTIPNDASVTGGISFLIESVCGGDAGCEVSANVDNVSVTLNP